MKATIICIGNRFVAKDAAGMAVFDILQAMQPLPAQVDLVEGGIAGLNLLPHLEQGGRVVFVDAVRGFAAEGEIVLFTHQEILQAKAPLHHDHGAGLAYVLAVLPKVCDGELPEEIVLLGLEGRCAVQTAEKAAEMAVVIATEGLRGLRRWEKR
jgi:hydrogenase maturation protease